MNHLPSVPNNRITKQELRRRKPAADAKMGALLPHTSKESTEKIYSGNKKRDLGRAIAFASLEKKALPR